MTEPAGGIKTSTLFAIYSLVLSLAALVLFRWEWAEILALFVLPLVPWLRSPSAQAAVAGGALMIVGGWLLGALRKFLTLVSWNLASSSLGVRNLEAGFLSGSRRGRGSSLKSRHPTIRTSRVVSFVIPNWNFVERQAAHCP